MKITQIILALVAMACSVQGADLTVTVPDAISTNLLLRVSNVYDYANNKKAGESRKAFVERLLQDHLRQIYLASKKEEAVQTASTNTTSTVDAEFPKP